MFSTTLTFSVLDIVLLSFAVWYLLIAPLTLRFVVRWMDALDGIPPDNRCYKPWELWFAYTMSPIFLPAVLVVCVVNFAGYVIGKVTGLPMCQGEEEKDKES